MSNETKLDRISKSCPLDDASVKGNCYECFFYNTCADSTYLANERKERIEIEIRK